jgi:hypothetical protein
MMIAEDDYHAFSDYNRYNYAAVKPLWFDYSQELKINDSETIFSFGDVSDIPKRDRLKSAMRACEDSEIKFRFLISHVMYAQQGADVSWFKTQPSLPGAIYGL